MKVICLFINSLKIYSSAVSTYYLTSGKHIFSHPATLKFIARIGKELRNNLVSQRYLNLMVRTPTGPVFEVDMTCLHRLQHHSLCQKKLRQLSLYSWLLIYSVPMDLSQFLPKTVSEFNLKEQIINLGILKLLVSRHKGVFHASIIRRTFSLSWQNQLPFMWTAVRPTGAEAVKMVSYELSKPVTRLRPPEVKLQCLHRKVFSLLSSKETCSIPFSRYHATGERPGIGITLGRVALRLFRDNWSPSENSWAGVLFCNSHCVNVRVNAKPGIEIAYQ